MYYPSSLSRICFHGDSLPFDSREGTIASVCVTLAHLSLLELSYHASNRPLFSSRPKCMIPSQSSGIDHSHMEPTNGIDCGGHAILPSVRERDAI